ncbi:MAG TPA: DUF6279 family lipoprotein [Ramlibacter sp.]|uniref:DUF6279 family lipoprotein n=1 Tax=Ramlibacter sp. TaxID=1917967 RepID=UPI002ED1DE11
MMKSLDSTRMGGIILALALGLALSACSAVKLGYSNLPGLAYWWLDGYADFSEEQAPVVREHIAQLHAWHRQKELPKIVDLLARMEQLAPGEVNPQQACSIVAEVQGRMRAVAVEGEPRIAAISTSMTPRELRHMQRKFRRNNERSQKEWLDLSPAERNEKRFDQMLERLETIYGRLDEPQRAVLRQRIQLSAFDAARSHAEWQRRQEELLKMLRRVAQHGTSDAEARGLLRAWYDGIEKAADPGYRAYQQVLLQEGCMTFSLVHHSTTPAQREQAAKRLRAYQRDLRDLVLAQP